MPFSECDLLKSQLDGLRPVEQKHLSQIRAFWQVALAYSSNALEGSTLTESETKVILEDGLTVSGKSLREHLEAVGHRDALAYLFQVYERGYDEATILTLHQLFFHRIEQTAAGRYRQENVLITGTDYLPPPHSEVSARMANFGANIAATLHPIEQAALAHIELVNIHPFIDGNGRTARLLMNLILLRAGYPIALIPPLYRSRYIETTSLGNKGNIRPFLSLLTEVAAQSLRDYLRLLSGLAR